LLQAGDKFGAAVQGASGLFMEGVHGLQEQGQRMMASVNPDPHPVQLHPEPTHKPKTESKAHGKPKHDKTKLATTGPYLNNIY
jgi:hypothetical protein